MGGRGKTFRNTPNDFWESICVVDNCWVWTKGMSGEYGRFSLYGTPYSTHTLAYKLYNNLALDTKVFICHTCDNKLCINPSHLYNGSYASNARDTVRRGRAKGLFTKETPTAFQKGCIPASRIITEQTARGIKMDLQTMRQCDVIRKYNVPRETVRGIARGISWASLEVVS